METEEEEKEGIEEEVRGEEKGERLTEMEESGSEFRSRNDLSLPSQL